MAIKVLFVCMGNICRSPTAQGVFEALVVQQGLSQQMTIDSAGTHAYHVGEKPDQRSQNAAKQRGIDLFRQKARKIKADDFDHFDYIVAMDRANYTDLRVICPSGLQHKLHLLMHFSPVWNTDEVPDPYYGGTNGFEHVLDMVESASEGFLLHIIKERQL